MASPLRAAAARLIPESVKQALRRAIYRFVKVPIDRTEIAYVFLRGEGIEIGALNRPMSAPAGCRVRNVDRAPADELRAAYPELKEALPPVDIVDDAERLATLADSSQDFVIACHVLEHLQNPILAMKNFLRVLRPGGVAYLAIPEKRRTFDRRRPVTPLEHLERDYREGPEWSKRQHFEEWVDLAIPPEPPLTREQAVEHLIATDYSIHFHVWTVFDMLEFFTALRLQHDLDFDVELVRSISDEVIVILRKGPVREFPVGL